MLGDGKIKCSSAWLDTRAGVWAMSLDDSESVGTFPSLTLGVGVIKMELVDPVLKTELADPSVNGHTPRPNQDVNTKIPITGRS